MLLFPGDVHKVEGCVGTVVTESTGIRDKTSTTILFLPLMWKRSLVNSPM